jgi:hypothetical protein
LKAKRGCALCTNVHYATLMTVMAKDPMVFGQVMRRMWTKHQNKKNKYGHRISIDKMSVDTIIIIIIIIIWTMINF